MKSNIIIISILAVVVLIFGVIIFVGGSTSNVIQDGQNVTIVDGKQIIEITARGGYTPNASLAKAGIPTILRFNTNGTFDCSSSVRIPSMSLSKMLPNSGSTDIDLGSPEIGTLAGICGMGMYQFEINFEG
ncbi:MAG: cupredoxin domain-containing protein [Candidatus Paceibacterota bacterium]